MSDPQAPAPAVPATLSVPAEQAPGWFHETERILPGPPSKQAVSFGPSTAVLQDHVAGVFGLARDVFADPALARLAPKVLELVVSAAKIAGTTL